MIIRIEVTMDEVVAFAKLHHANSPSQAKMRRMQTFLLPGIMFVFFTFLAVNHQSLLMFGLGAAATAMLYVAMVGKVDGMHLEAVEKQTKALFSEGENQAIFGPRELEITPEYLVTRSKVHEFVIRWSAVEKIVETLDHGFIYWCGVAAHHIPKSQLSKEEYRAFMDAARKAWEAARKPTTASEQ